MYLWKFGQNPSTGSKDIASERSYEDAYADPHKKQYVPHLRLGGDIKRKIFSGNFDIFLIFAHNIDCGYTLEPPRRRIWGNKSSQC